MHNTTDNLKAEYIKITSNSKSATASANSATELVKIVEDKHTNLKVFFIFFKRYNIFFLFSQLMTKYLAC